MCLREKEGHLLVSLLLQEEYTLNDLLAASDLISLHCALTDETVQIINAECLQQVKPGAFLVNTGSSQLLDDCDLKQLLIDGTIAGCALDGLEGPQWMEAWVKEMPNVLILPCSEEVWMEIREKAISILQSYFLHGFIPRNAVSVLTRRDPAAQFLVAFKSKDTIGLRSFAAGGKLLLSQAPSRLLEACEFNAHS